MHDFEKQPICTPAVFGMALGLSQIDISSSVVTWLNRLFFQIKTALAITAVLLLTLSSHSVLAEIHYVSDNVMVPLRAGAGNEFRIINSRIRSGTKMELLDNPSGDWAQVRMIDGTEGWIRKQYLQRQPVAQILLDDAQKKREAAEAKLAEQTAQLTELENKYSTLLASTSSATRQHTELNTEYQNLKALSQDTINLSRRYQTLLAEHEVLLTQHDALIAENDGLRSDQTISHGLYAIALLLGGMILAIVLPMLRPRKRYSDTIL